MKKKSKLSKKAAKKAEIEFLANYDASLYPHPSVSVDVALFTVDDGKLKVLLTHRDHQPALGKWSLPGTFVGIFESLNQAASRALATKTGVSGIFLEQLYTFGQPDRDPRTRVISVVFVANVPAKAELQAGDDAADAKWFRVDELPELAFDHEQIVNDGLSFLVSDAEAL